MDMFLSVAILCLIFFVVGLGLGADAAATQVVRQKCESSCDRRFIKVHTPGKDFKSWYCTCENTPQE
jgi:hypothetical protein